MTRRAAWAIIGTGVLASLVGLVMALTTTAVFHRAETEFRYLPMVGEIFDLMLQLQYEEWEELQVMFRGMSVIMAFIGIGLALIGFGILSYRDDWRRRR